MRTTIASWLLLTLLAGSVLASPPSRVTGPEQRITIKVTSKGFEPAIGRARAGSPIILVVTRTTDRTCATELVIRDRKIRRSLPLNRAVEIRLALEKPGRLRIACGMDMVSGTLIVQ